MFYTNQIDLSIPDNLRFVLSRPKRPYSSGTRFLIISSISIRIHINLFSVTGFILVPDPELDPYHSQSQIRFISISDEIRNLDLVLLVFCPSCSITIYILVLCFFFLYYIRLVDNGGRLSLCLKPAMHLDTE